MSRGRRVRAVTWTRGLLSAALVALGATASAAGDRVAESRPAHRELGIVPLVGGDTDVGFGFGELSTLARVAPGVSPYVWSVESAAFISFAPGRGPDGDLAIPYQDYFVQITVPHLAGDRLRLQIRPSFTKETTQRYYGLGNASPAPADDDLPARDFYGRTHPTLWVRARYRLFASIYGELGASYTQNWLDVRPASTLDAEMHAGSSTVRGLLGDAQDHGVLLGEVTLQLDTRDDEIDPERGQFHQLKLRVSPAAGPALPYAYQQIDLTTRGYVTLVPQRLVAAGRAVFDLQLGHPPFYELARYEDTFALGGLNGVRGVPGQRYYGKVKAFANGELRSRLVSFTFLKKHLSLGVVGFFDLGRLWSELGYHPELDGRGWNLKYGVGGGLRLQEGRTFVVRADVAWSPDARPIGGYVGAGQMF
jgi:outer membrane protein assembly factor BamA